MLQSAPNITLTLCMRLLSHTQQASAASMSVRSASEKALESRNLACTCHGAQFGVSVWGSMLTPPQSKHSCPVLCCQRRGQLCCNACRVYVARCDVSHGGQCAILAHGQQHVLACHVPARRRLLPNFARLLADFPGLLPDFSRLLPHVTRLQPH